MKLYTDYKKLNLLAKNFYNVTNILISIFDHQNKLICAYPDKLCDFCTEVRKNDILYERCMQSDYTALHKCKETRKPHIYKCHMGLTEIAMPILYNNMLAGYILLGQVNIEKDTSHIIAAAKKAAQKYNLNFDILEHSVKKIPTLTNEYINSLSQVLEMCANYIWINDIIRVKNSAIANNLNVYINENIDKDMSVERICRKFGFSRSTLYQISKEQFGCGFSQYVQRCRINKAKELLKNEVLSVIEVSNAVGFADVNYFVRAFKKTTGETPKKFQSLF